MRRQSYGLTDAGRVRTENQDRILCDDARGLYAVCDGMGGRRRGDLAAGIAAAALQEFIAMTADPMEITWPVGFNHKLSLSANRLLTAAQLANRQVWHRSEESIENLGMGTTICAALITETEVSVVNVGDSRAYLCRNGELRQLTVDDTVGGSATSKWKSVLTEAAGQQETANLHLAQCPLTPGDRLLLCSDGLHGCLEHEQIHSLLHIADPPESAAHALLQATLAAGAPDNVSIILVDIAECGCNEPSPLPEIQQTKKA